MTLVEVVTFGRFTVKSSSSQQALVGRLARFEPDLGVREEIAKSLLARTDRFGEFEVTVSHGPPESTAFCYYTVAGRTVHIIGNDVHIEIPERFVQGR